MADGPGRVPPQALAAEEAVLGGILLDNAAMDRVTGTIGPDDFYRESHRCIFRAMRAVAERGDPVDLITLGEELKAREELANVGGLTYLAQLAERVPTAANIGHYATIVREKSLLRTLISTATSIATRGYEGDGSVKELLDRAEQDIFAISDREVQQGFVRLDSLVMPTLETIDLLHKRKELVTGVPTGYIDLDKMTAGLQPSDLIIVAGRPSMGKTAFCLNIAQHAALTTQQGVAVFSLEMSKEQLAMRMLCSEARVDLAGVRTGHFRDEEFEALASARAEKFAEDQTTLSRITAAFDVV